MGAGVFLPQLVHALGNSIVTFFECGEYCACVITKMVELYTWVDATHNVGILVYVNNGGY